MAEFASTAVGNAGLATGIIGTSLGVLNGMGGIAGLLGATPNIGGAGHACADTRRIAELEAKLALETANNYSDKSDVEVFKQAIAMSNAVDEKQNANFRTIAEAVAKLDKEAAVNQARIDCLANSIQKDIDAVRAEARNAIALESERRINGDQGLYGYVNATFVPGKLVMPKENICPEFMDRYNTWVAPVN